MEGGGEAGGCGKTETGRSGRGSVACQLGLGPGSPKGLFGTQEFHRNLAGISQESVQFYIKNAGTGIFSRNPTSPEDV